MEPTEAYFLLFIDSLTGNLTIIPQLEFVFRSMKLFGYDQYLILITAILGSNFAIIINYLCGIVIYKLLYKWNNYELQKNGVRNNKIHAGKKFFFKYYMLLLLISIWPMGGKFIQLVAGMYHLNLSKVLLICIVCKAVYYYVQIIIVVS